MTDPNLKSTTYGYTAMRDLQTVSYPDGGSVTVNYQGYAVPLNVITTVAASPDPAIVSSVLYDNLGRPATTTGPDGTTTETYYDSLGRVVAVTNPHSSTPSSTDGTTSSSYDVLGQKRLLCHPDNGNNTPCVAGTDYLEWSYNDNVTTFYDELRNSWQRTNDALGRLTNVVEPGSLQTGYTYDALGNLWKVTQTGVAGETPRTRSFTYDSLSRLICASNPENSQNDCPTSATTTLPSGVVGYGYDLNGNLSSKTDARNVTTSYTYDALNRLTSKTYSGPNTNSAADAIAAATLASCYQYDTGPSGISGGNFIGRLTYEWTQSGTCQTSIPSSGYQSKRTILAYDAMGRVKQEQQCHLSKCTTGTPFSQIMNYDLAGNRTSYTNGIQSLIFGHVYDAAGRLQGVNSSWIDNDHPMSLFTVGSFYPNGAVGSATVGLGIYVTNTYDKRFRFTGTTAAHP